ncbi:WAS/WASL-interacting protein family member 1-like [Osmerus eperlanus]|uniref:WAS/WASL-interacting protein family member 1-like n=1 Tax=Osmerus eperlanus TaxID=29151 RepID=UPI002E0F3410
MRRKDSASGAVAPKAEGQLGHGEGITHASSPLLVNPSALKKVTRIDTGDSYSAALADGELFVWGRVPPASQDRAAASPRVWTPQPLSLGGREVCEVACGSWHMMALTTAAPGSREGNVECELGETGARFKELGCSPPLMTGRAKENSEQVCVGGQAQPPVSLAGVRPQTWPPAGPRCSGAPDLAPAGLGNPASPGERGRERGDGEGRERDSEGDGPLHDPAVAAARAPTALDGTGNGRSSIKPGERDEREAGGAVGSGEGRRGRRRGGPVFICLRPFQTDPPPPRPPSTGSLPQIHPGHLLVHHRPGQRDGQWSSNDWRSRPLRSFHSHPSSETQPTRPRSNSLSLNPSLNPSINPSLDLNPSLGLNPSLRPQARALQQLNMHGTLPCHPPQFQTQTETRANALPMAGPPSWAGSRPSPPHQKLNRRAVYSSGTAWKEVSLSADPLLSSRLPAPTPNGDPPLDHKH